MKPYESPGWLLAFDPFLDFYRGRREIDFQPMLHLASRSTRCRKSFSISVGYFFLLYFFVFSLPCYALKF